MAQSARTKKALSYFTRIAITAACVAMFLLLSVFVLLQEIWDIFCLVFPLSVENKASYVGKHWVENWL